MPKYLARHSDHVEGRGVRRYRNDSYILRHKMGALFECGKRCVVHYSGQKCLQDRQARNIEISRESTEITSVAFS